MGEGLGASKELTTLFRALKTNSTIFTPQEASAFESAAKITSAVVISQQADFLKNYSSRGRGSGRGGGRWRQNRDRGRGSDRNSSDFFVNAVDNLNKDKP